MEVHKYGGTSIGSINGINNILTQIESRYNNNISQIVVVSAFSGVTNLILNFINGDKSDVEFFKQEFFNIHFSICNKLTNHELHDRLIQIINKHLNIILNSPQIAKINDAVCVGEYLASELLCFLIKSEVNLESKILDPREFIVSNNYLYSYDKTKELFNLKIKDNILNTKVNILPGFASINNFGEPSNLGRNSSDVSAAILAMLISAEKLVFWSDVEGIYNADPRMFPNALKFEKININSLKLISQSGAKIIHQSAIDILIELNKDCIVKFGSTFNSDNITKDTEVIFSGDCKPNLPAVVSIENNKLSEIRIIHESLSNWFGFASQIFKITSKVGVNLIGYNYSIENDYISIFVNEGDKLKLCSELLNNLVINREKMMKVNLLILGYGNVGKELVNRLLNVKFSDCEINLKGIIRSKTEVIVDESNKYNTNGFNFIFRDNYENDIQDLSRFGLNSNSSQVIIIDVTSSFDVSSNYLNWMSLGWHVITANKIANSGDFTYYSKLHENKLLDETSFLYEANVGAGLPIIRTIRDIYLTGDTIIKFRAVLSGTLSFIFNQMSIGKTFKTSVLDAFSLGYTEPDPRDDLSGLDFARKVVIILREMGLKISLDQIKLTELLPQNLIDCSKDDFFSNISSLDDFFNLSFSDLINKKIQLIAEFENDLISVKLVKLESNDIFTTLKNGENLIEIYTKNYNNMPLIIRGPGAGKEVTVSGILSDLLKVISK